MLRSCSFTAASEVCRLMLFARAADLQVFLHMQLICRNNILYYGHLYTLCYGHLYTPCYGRFYVLGYVRL